MDEKGLGRRLQAMRQTAGLTQQGLCQKADLSYSTLAKIERGAIKAPSIFTIQSIAEALGTTLDELIGQVTPKPVPTHRHRSKSGIGFVYFDVNGCLVRSYHRAFARLAEESGQTPDAVETIFWHYNDLICRGEMSIEDFNKTLAEHIHMESVDWSQCYLSEVEAMPGMSELVTWVSQNYGVGLLTNIMPGLLSSMRSSKVIPDIDYQAIVDSSEVHAIKPELEIYKIALEKSGYQNNEILLVDDTRANLMAAEKLGWHVMWFDDSRPEESADRIRQTLDLSTDSSVAPKSPLVSPLPAAQNAYVPAR